MSTDTPADDLFPPDVLRAVEQERHRERMEQIRKREAIRRALATEEFVVNAWKMEDRL